jgi:nitrile hydratase subunit beta
VRVRRMRPAGHTRCPRYVRGATGVVEAIRGNDPLPDIGPYKGPVQPVYAVAFDSEALFGPSEEGRWTVLLDLFEDYLEAV